MWKSMTKNKSDYFSEDTVFVQARGVSALYGQHNEVYSTFSGFMVIPNIGRTGVVTTPPPMGNIIGWMSTIYTLCWMLLNVLQSYCLCACFQVKFIYSSIPGNARTLHVIWHGVVFVSWYPLMVTGHAILLSLLTIIVISRGYGIRSRSWS